MQDQLIFGHLPNVSLRLYEQSQYGKTVLDSGALPMVEEYLDATKELIMRAANSYSKLFAVRLQIDFPKTWRFETCLFPDKAYLTVVSIFNHINKPNARNMFRGVSHQNHKLYYSYAFEYDHEKRPIISMLMIFDGSVYRGLGPSSQNSFALKKIIEFAVCGGLKVPLHVVHNQNLIHYASIHHIDKHSDGAQDEMRDLMKQGAYLCGAYNKLFGFNVLPFRVGVIGR